MFSSFPSLERFSQKPSEDLAVPPVLLSKSGTSRDSRHDAGTAKKLKKA